MPVPRMCSGRISAAYASSGELRLLLGRPRPQPFDIGGVTKVVVNYARETIAVAGSGLDLGTFAQSGNAVTVAIAIGSDARAVQVRMARKGAGLKY